MTLKIGIFGGTFNPIHLGHLILAECAREELRLDRVVFIPASHPPHKAGRGLLPAPARLDLVRAAIQHHPQFVASEIEMERRGASYSIETVATLRQQVPAAQWFLLMGQDMLRVPWKNWATLKRLATIAVAGRPGAAARSRQQGVRWLTTMPPVGISATEIRERVRRGRSIRYLVPQLVERIIRERGYYAK